MNRRHSDFQSVAEETQDTESQELIDTQNSSLQTSLQRKSKNGSLELPLDLAEIVGAWPKLSEHIRAAIWALAIADKSCRVDP